jgi:hypothetical protein
MVFQKRFNLDTVALEHTKKYKYLCLNISTTGNFHKAVNDLERQRQEGPSMPSKGT